mmetsp:Transcript_33100/g.49968  ORF Transcript_33100/g.49968 Transcript_33100/m.49968 type:complete len:201 (-) Transcript_33100:370-972(-)
MYHLRLLRLVILVSSNCLGSGVDGLSASSRAIIRAISHIPPLSRPPCCIVLATSATSFRVAEFMWNDNGWPVSWRNQSERLWSVHSDVSFCPTIKQEPSGSSLIDSNARRTFTNSSDDPVLRSGWCSRAFSTKAFLTSRYEIGFPSSLIPKMVKEDLYRRPIRRHVAILKFLTPTDIICLLDNRCAFCAVFSLSLVPRAS